ncbi:hypothetical protein [Mesorhizobium sp. M1348]|uniref:hypothetical protein n=1 Tax=Mesorhizobium sp. M1348 TaxID=2957089 RepID=UPI0033383B31
MQKSFEIEIDGDPHETQEKELTADQILGLASLARDEYYLTEIKGQHTESYQGKGDEKVHLHPGSKFISTYTGATPVSDGQSADAMLAGAKLFAAQLRAAGFEVTELGDEHITFPYEVRAGSHAGLTITMGLVVLPDFPLTPPTGPHINHILHPNKGGGEHPTGGIHDSSGHSKHFGAGWQYWSRPFQTWQNGSRTAGRYMAFINGLWATQ